MAKKKTVQRKGGRPWQQMLLQLGQWYAQNARPLPFRTNVHWYRTLVSEVMLQQTRVQAMLPAYEKFLHRFPDVSALAQAPESEVMERWAGLGYYNRARNLQKTAQAILTHHRGNFPESMDEALALPGIGPYTASAVLSIAYERPHHVLDGNVHRVLGRLFLDDFRSQNGEQAQNASVSTSEQQQKPSALTRKQQPTAPASTKKQQENNGSSESTADPTRAFTDGMAAALMESSPLAPSEHNQALMELGATICVSGLPGCLDCPVRAHCQAFNSGGPELAARIPARQSARKQDLLLQTYWIRTGDTLLLLSSSDRPLFRKDWFFPCRILSAEGHPIYEDSETSLFDTPTLRGHFAHSIMNYRIKVEIYQCTSQIVRGGSRSTPDRKSGSDRAHSRADRLQAPIAELNRHCPSSIVKKAISKGALDF